jgi:hypothetical protein
MDKPRRVVVLGNCQTDSLRELLQHYTRWQVINWREHVLVKATEQARIRQELPQADIVIMQPLSVSRFGTLGTTELIAAGMNPVVIPNLHFEGLHPEIVHFGTLGNRMPSPLGDYHSGLACAAFLAGLRPEDALDCYEDDSLFARSGLFGLWASSWSEYIARESRCDITMADYLDAAGRSRPLFYSVNHPAGEVIDELARRIVRHVTGQVVIPQLVRDALQNDIIYPVWGPIVRRHKLSYGSPPGFYLQAPRSFLPLLDYLRQAYVLYAKHLRNAALPARVLHLREMLSAKGHGVSPAAAEARSTAMKDAVSERREPPRRKWWPFARR